jgi:hypothetical protein
MYLHISFVSKKYATLGIEVKENKSGKGIGMGRINEKDHVVQMTSDGNE